MSQAYGAVQLKYDDMKSKDTALQSRFDHSQDIADKTLEDQYRGAQAIDDSKDSWAMNLGRGVVGGLVGLGTFLTTGSPTATAAAVGATDKAITSKYGTPDDYLAYTRGGLDNFLALKDKQNKQYTTEAIQLGSLAYQGADIATKTANMNVYDYYEQNLGDEFHNQSWADWAAEDHSILDLHKGIDSRFGQFDNVDSYWDRLSIMMGRK
tara:strand:+ start:1757 stop:2383 length:627 start_codon:yes stop_codon:yes gene_type:complete